MGREHPLIRAVVVRSHDERGVGAEVRRPPRGTDGGGGVVRAGSGDDGDPAARGPLADCLDRDGDEPIALRLGEGRGFAGRPDRNEAVDPGKHLPADESSERPFVTAHWSPVPSAHGRAIDTSASRRRTSEATIARPPGVRR